jgi:hypothetical protein
MAHGNIFDPACPSRQATEIFAEKSALLVIDSLGKGAEPKAVLRRHIF